MINTEVPAAAPARGALIALLEMGPSERAQRWFPKQFDYGMYLLGEPLDKVRKFQAHVIGLAMETDIWAARCRMIHHGRTGSVSSRKAAAGEYAAALLRTRRKDLPITKRIYMGLPARRRGDMIQQWEVAFPTPAKAPLYAWATRTPGPAEPTRQEKRAKRKIGETEQRTATPAAEPGHLRALRAIERKRGRDGAATVTAHPTAPANRGDKKPTPPIGTGPHQLAPPPPPQLGARRASAAAKPRGTG